MASSFINPSKRISYHHRTYGRGEICFKKGHSILVKFDSPHEDLHVNPLQGNKGNLKKYKWLTNTNTNLTASKNNKETVKKVNLKSSTKRLKTDNSDKIQSSINFLKKEGYKIFKMVEI